MSKILKVLRHESMGCIIPVILLIIASQVSIQNAFLIIFGLVAYWVADVLIGFVLFP